MEGANNEKHKQNECSTHSEFLNVLAFHTRGGHKEQHVDLLSPFDLTDLESQIQPLFVQNQHKVWKNDDHEPVTEKNKLW